MSRASCGRCREVIYDTGDHPLHIHNHHITTTWDRRNRIVWMITGQTIHECPKGPPVQQIIRWALDRDSRYAFEVSQ